MLALPEGSKDAARSLMSFARLDGVNRLLGGKATAFDMRAPDRIYFRVPDRAVDAAKASAAKKADAAKLASANKADAGPKTEATAKPQTKEKE